MKLNRRTMLKGLLGGSLITVGLPPLDIFFDSHGKAYAADGSFPRRFGLFFWGNGILPEFWTPKETGENWEPTYLLEPLASMKSDLSLITGMEVKLPNLEAHGTGPAGVLTGAQNSLAGDEHYLAPTIDRLVAEALGGETVYRSIEAAVEPHFMGLSYSGPKSISPAEWEPTLLFERLFGVNFTAPGDNAEPNPKLSLRRSVLDAVMGDAEKLKGKLGKTDLERVEMHLDSIRELEQRLWKLENEPPDFDACVLPSDPGELPDIDGRPQMRERARAMADLITMAFACDLTRIGSLWYSKPVSDVLFPGISAGHHQLTHDEPGDQPEVQECVRFIMEDLRYFYESLRSIPEGDSNLLNNSIVFATSDNGYGRTHQIDEYPLIIGGTGGGQLKTGFHHRSQTKGNTSDVVLAMLQAMGLSISSFGNEEAYSDKPMTEILA